MKVGYPLVGCTLVLCVWSLLAYMETFSPVLLPGPNRVIIRLFEKIIYGELLPDIRTTLYHWLVGFVLGVAAGIPLGLLMGHFKEVRQAFSLVIDAVRALPVVALMPLFLIFFGVGSTAKIAVAAWASALAVLVNTMYGAGRVKELWLLSARTLGATPAQIFFKVVVPGSLPDIVVGSRIAVSHALVVVIAAEMMLGGGSSGLGRKLTDAAMLFRTADAYATLCIIGLLGYVSNVFFQSLEDRFLPWVRK